MSKRFDLEQEILKCWNIIDDIDVLYGTVCNKDISRDDIANALLGLKTLYALKFDRCFSTFEDVVREIVAERVVREAFEQGCE